METDSALWMVKEKIADGRIIMRSSESAGMTDGRCWSSMLLMLQEVVESLFVTYKEMKVVVTIGLSCSLHTSTYCHNIIQYSVSYHTEDLKIALSR